MREFKVQKGVRGYVVRIGCQVAGFSNEDDLLAAIQEYIKDPEATEKKYYNGPTEAELVCRDNTCGEGRANGVDLDMPDEAPPEPTRL